MQIKRRKTVFKGGRRRKRHPSKHLMFPSRKDPQWRSTHAFRHVLTWSANTLHLSFLPTCLFSSAFNSDCLIDRSVLAPQWQTPPPGEWAREEEEEGRRPRAGRTGWRRLPPLVAAVASVIRAEKAKDKHRALRSKTGPKSLVVWGTALSLLNRKQQR